MNGFMKLMFLFTAFALLTSCGNKSNDKPTVGSLQIQFEHRVSGEVVVKDELNYINASDNLYQISGLKYFISDVTFHKHDGSSIVINSTNPAHYVDIDIPETLTWQVSDNIPASVYDSISFTFGLNEQLNKSNSFVNFPEVNMAWPDPLGGGYHFMMMDGWFIDSQGQAAPFSFHLGTGQIYTGGMETANITGFVQNYFHVKLPASSFTIVNNQIKSLKIIMNIDKWFTTPTNWDFNQWSMTMQNQTAMQAIKDNGGDVFTFKTE
jgi:hypothetical protein